MHILDGSKSEHIGDIAVGLRPRGMALHAPSRTLYVAVSNDNRIDIVDLATRRVTGQLPSGPDPEVTALHPDGKGIFVANEADNLISVVDIPARKIISDAGRLGARRHGCQSRWALRGVPGSRDHPGRRH